MCAGLGCIYTKWDGGCGCHYRPLACEEEKQEEYELYLEEQAEREMEIQAFEEWQSKKNEIN